MSGSTRSLDRRGVTWGLIAVAIVVALTFIGSDRLVWFDAALVGYLFGIVFAVFGVAYRYAVWLRRPSDRDVEPPRVGCVPATQGAQRRRAAVAGRHASAGPGVHPAPVPGAVARPSAGVLGLHPRRARHVPAHARPAALRERRPAGRPLPGVRVDGSAPLKFDADSVVGWFIFHAPRHRRGPRAGRRVHLPAPPAARPGRAGGGAQRRLPRARRPVRRVGDRPVPHGVEHVARGPVLLGAQHDPRADRDPRA